MLPVYFAKSFDINPSIMAQDLEFVGRRMNENCIGKAHEYMIVAEVDGWRIHLIFQEWSEML